MCAMAIAAARVCANLADLACADLPLAELGAAVSATLCRLAPHEGFCLIGFDPVSGLRSFQTASNALVGVEARLARNELVEQDPQSVRRAGAMRSTRRRAGWAG